MLRQRDVEMILHNKGYERGTRDILIMLVEEVNDMRGIVNEIIESISSMASVITTLNVVADGMKMKIDSMGRRDDDGGSTHKPLED
jgi:hypothetical protein